MVQRYECTSVKNAMNCHRVLLQSSLGLVGAIFIAVVASCTLAASREDVAARLLDEQAGVVEEDDGCLLQSAVLRQHPAAPRPASQASRTVAPEDRPSKTEDQVSQPAALETAHEQRGHQRSAVPGHPDAQSSAARRRRRSVSARRRRALTAGPVFTQISQDISRVVYTEFDQAADSDDSDDVSPMLADLVQRSWWWSLVSLIIPICLGSLMFWMFKQWLTKMIQPLDEEELASIRSEADDEHEASVAALSTCEQLEVSPSGLSWLLPLRHQIDTTWPNVISFDIHRQPQAHPISVNISCIPDGDIWAKIELAHIVPGQGHIIPLASCSLVDRATSMEALDIKGVMQSWLALLLQEKNACAVSEVELSDQHCPIQPSRSVNLRGVVEVLAHLGENPLEHHALEIRDGFGNLIGTLEPCPDSHYALMQDGRRVVEIEAGPQSQSLLFSRQGDVMALAQNSALDGTDSDNLQTDQDDFLQLDVYANACAAAPDCSSASAYPELDVAGERFEVVVMLVCTLAMVVFDLKL